MRKYINLLALAAALTVGTAPFAQADTAACCKKDASCCKSCCASCCKK